MRIVEQYAPFAVTKTTVDALVTVTGWGGDTPGSCPATALTPSSVKTLEKAGYIDRTASPKPGVTYYRATHLGQLVLTLAHAAAKVKP